MDGNTLPFGGVCVAYDVVQGDGDKDGDVMFAFARCSKKDIYNKSIARKIAAGRLEKWIHNGSSKLHVVHLNGRKPKEAIFSAMRSVGQQPSAVKAASQHNLWDAHDAVEEAHVLGQ